MTLIRRSGLLFDSVEMKTDFDLILIVQVDTVVHFGSVETKVLV